MIHSEIEKLAPFVRRSRIALTGRERLSRISGSLAFVWVTEDLSENSLREIGGRFRCPVVTAGTSADLERLFGFPTTKILGFKRSSLADRILQLLQTPAPPAAEAEPAPPAAEAEPEPPVAEAEPAPPAAEKES